MHESGEYRYHLTLSPPFLPPCLHGKVGIVEGYRKKSKLTCNTAWDKVTHAKQHHTGSERIITGTGCPNHAYFRNVRNGKPRSIKKRSLSVWCVRSLRGLRCLWCLWGLRSVWCQDM